jgi:hypothetical protein
VPLETWFSSPGPVEPRIQAARAAFRRGDLSSWEYEAQVERLKGLQRTALIQEWLRTKYGY